MEHVHVYIASAGCLPDGDTDCFSQDEYAWEYFKDVCDENGIDIDGTFAESGFIAYGSLAATFADSNYAVHMERQPGTQYECEWYYAD